MKKNNKKVAIITLSCALNYGAMLQTVALYHYIETLGYTPVVIDYVTERYWYDNPEYSSLIYRHQKNGGVKLIKRLIWETRHLFALRMKRNLFRSFLIDNVIFSNTYHYEQEFFNAPIDADVFISGSDQIWNPEYIWSGIIDNPYYLSFVPDNVPKVSYASSFGKKELSIEESDETRKYLSRYQAISVREDSGIDILKRMNLIGRVVLDPTLLVEREYWNSLADKYNVNTGKDYLLYFTIGRDTKLEKLAVTYCEKNGLNLKKIIFEKESFLTGAKEKLIHRNIDIIVLPSVYQWLALFKNASYIVTNSYHGTVFALNFRIPFSSSIHVSNSGRITNLLNLCALNNRTIDKYDIGALADQINNAIDWNGVDDRLDKHRKDSQNWLSGELSKVI